MKNIIIILTLILSISLFAKKYNEFPQEEKGFDSAYQEKTDFEAGVMFGYITSSGLLIKYNIDNSLSLRASGYIVKIDNTLVYNSKLSLTNSLHNSKFGEFYLIGSAGVFNFSGEFDDENIFFLGLGLGFKYKTEKGLSLFLELEENIFLPNSSMSNFLLVPIPTIGFSVDF